MPATSAPIPVHEPDASDFYHPDDDVLPRNSPDLKPLDLTLKSPSPNPPFAALRKRTSLLHPGRRRRVRRAKHRPNQGDALLVDILDGGRHPEIAATAGQQGLAPDEDEDDEEYSDTESGTSESSIEQDSLSDLSHRGEHPESGDQGPEPGREAGGPDKTHAMALQALQGAQNGDAFDLKTLALGALAAVPGTSANPKDGLSSQPLTNKTKAHHRPEPLPPFPSAARRDNPADAAFPTGTAPIPIGALPNSPNSLGSPRDQGQVAMMNLSLSSPTGTLQLTPTSHGELPPIVPPPRSETNGYGTSLPSIRSHLADVVESPAAEKEMTLRYAGYPASSPNGMSRLTGLQGHQTSPPISPHDTFRRGDLPSPNHIPLVTSPYYPYPNLNGMHRIGMDYAGSSSETPNSTDQSASTPATSVADRMSIDGITHPQPGGYVCLFEGCTAPPFQTQYLLNSHANVHSSARPHYCPVKGCPRSEGGKGFKRKNEMIRHGLVHDSPGYVCPFCADREHRYPRPDNLQRHVRVHHVDKDKDDPLLRDVLAQRPDGPSRGRRRRGGPL